MDAKAVEKANEKWILQMKSMTKNVWIWPNSSNMYDMSGEKIVPFTLKGYVELAGTVSKRFMKTLVGLPKDGDYDEAKIWATLDGILGDADE